MKKTWGRLVFLGVFLAGVLATAVTGGRAAPVQGVTDNYLVFLPAVSHRYDLDNLIFDMAAYLAGPLGNGTLYEVQHSNGSQARHQTQVDTERFYHTKGELAGEWEELWYDDQFIYRGTDTSPGNAQYYTLRDNGQYGSAWAPRFWKVGEIFERNPQVTFYNKSNCAPTNAGSQRTWLRFDAHFPQYTFSSGITLYDVVRFSWLLTLDGEPREQYYYARGYGLVAWDGNEFGNSYVSEIHQPGARPDNPREVISCLNTSGITPTGLPAPLLWAK